MALLNPKALLDPGHPLRSPGDQGITLYLGELESDEHPSTRVERMISVAQVRSKDQADQFKRFRPTRQATPSLLSPPARVHPILHPRNATLQPGTGHVSFQ